MDIWWKLSDSTITTANCLAIETVKDKGATGIDFTKLSCASEGAIACKCATGYFWNITECTACSSDCAECTAADKCTKCNVGASLISDACVKCSSNCIACSDASTCTKCADYFFLESAACVACTDANGTCPTAKDTIGECKPYYWKDTSGTTPACKACSATTGVLDCKGDPATVTNHTACTLGDTDGYYLVSGKGCVKPTASSNCLEAKLDTGTTYICSKCAERYVISVGKCVLCSSINNGSSHAATAHTGCNAGADKSTAATLKGCEDVTDSSDVVHLMAFNNETVGSQACVECANCKSGCTWDATND